MWGCSTRAYRLCRNGSTSTKRNLRKRKRENNPQRGNGDVRYQFAQQALLARADEVINRDLVCCDCSQPVLARTCRAAAPDRPAASHGAARIMIELRNKHVDRQAMLLSDRTLRAARRRFP